MSIKSIEKITSNRLHTLDPFIFTVYHNDDYPVGNSKCEAPTLGNGQDFDDKKPWRMYHGRKVPGFPYHPHSGFETITATLDGIVDHCDSLGNAGRYGFGDLQWMTAGHGINHSEMFPLVNQDKGNLMRLFQIWINLPARNRLVKPGYVMHWHEKIPIVTFGQNGTSKMTVWAGDYGTTKPCEPTPDSYANEPNSLVKLWLLKLQPGDEFTIPKESVDVNRLIHFVEGKKISVDGQNVPVKNTVVLASLNDIKLVNTGDIMSEVLFMQGNKLGEPIVQYGPFVMSTKKEIELTIQRYRETEFGGWPWASHDHHFGAEKGRFSIQDGKEEIPHL